MHKDHLCIVTEYCEGGDLYRRLKACTSHLPESQVLQWLLQTAQALAHLHDRQVLHRDLKTQNIFLTKDGCVKLGDFGIARTLCAGGELCSTIVGTPFYMSPELMASKPYDFKTDMWSLGCVLHEMTSLQHAFSADDMSGLALKILRGTHSPTPSMYSADLRDLITRLLSKAPEARPDAAQLLAHPLLLSAQETSAGAGASFEAESAAHFARVARARQLTSLPPGARVPARRPSAPVPLARSRQASTMAQLAGGADASPAGLRRSELSQATEERRLVEANIRTLQALPPSAGGAAQPQAGPPSSASRVAAARRAYGGAAAERTAAPRAAAAPLRGGPARASAAAPPAAAVVPPAMSSPPPPPPPPPLARAVPAHVAEASACPRHVQSAQSRLRHAEPERRMLLPAPPPPPCSPMRLVAEERGDAGAAAESTRESPDDAALGRCFSPTRASARGRAGSSPARGGESPPRAPPPRAHRLRAGPHAGDPSVVSASVNGPLEHHPRAAQATRDPAASQLGLACLEAQVGALEDALKAALPVARVRRHSEYATPSSARAASYSPMPPLPAAFRAAALAALRARGAERHAADAARRAAELEEARRDADVRAAKLAAQEQRTRLAAQAAADFATLHAADVGGPTAPLGSSSEVPAAPLDASVELQKLREMHAALSAHIGELQASLQDQGESVGGSLSPSRRGSLPSDDDCCDAPDNASDSELGEATGESSTDNKSCVGQSCASLGACLDAEEAAASQQDEEGDRTVLARETFIAGGGASARVAALRSACERSLGAPLFTKLYSYLRERAAAHASGAPGDPGTATDEEAFRQELRTRLGPGKAHFVALMDRLMYEEEQQAQEASSV